MRRFVYAPDVSIYISTKNHGVIDVSLDCIDGSVHRVLDGVSSASFTLQNPRNKYIADKNGDPIFRPMDRIVIFLTRIYKPMQVFSGYLDDVPFEQFIPGPVTFNASCTIKRLLYTYFDPSLPYTMQRLAKFGWTYDPTDGSLRDNSENFFDLDTGGGLGDLIRFMMHEVGNWNISDKPDETNTVHIMPLPKSYITKVAKVMTKDMEEVVANQSNVEKILKAFMNIGGSEAAGAPATGGTNSDTNPVPPKFEGIYKGLIYGSSMLEGGSDGIGSGGPKAAKVVSEAMSQLGVPYVWAAESENKGFDCSGLTQWAYLQVGINLPHHAQSQMDDSRGEHVSTKISNLKPGDLVFFNTVANSEIADHVGIADGKGNMIHAPHTGDKVKVTNLSTYFFPIVAARRFLHETDTSVPSNGPTNSDGIPADQIALAQKYGTQYGVDPLVLLAIGGHETQWGRLGAGRPPGSFVLGYGVTDSGILSKYSGIDNQYHYAALTLAGWGAKTIADIMAGKAAAYASDPAWENGVQQVYENISGHKIPIDPSIPTPPVNPEDAGEIGDVRVPTGFPITTTFHISPNPYGRDDIIFRAVKVNSNLAQNQIQIYVPGAKDDSSDQARQWHQQGTTNVTIDSSANNPNDKPFPTANPTTVEASSSALDINANLKPYDSQKIIGESTDKFIDLYNIAQSQVFGNALEFPTAGDVTEAEVLSGQRALYNDIPLIKWIETACTASGRRYQSTPNGDFLAFYPDYFGWANEKLYSTPYLKVADLEIISGDITLSDHELTTHYFTTADIDRSGDITIWDKMESLVASVENSGAFKAFTNVDEDFDFTTFLKRYGPRPFVDVQLNIKHPGVQYLYGWQHFLLKWAKQFVCRLETTFLPEIYPGGLIEISSKGIIMFVESVTHSWNRETGFTTSTELSAPATKDNKNAGMVLAG